MRASVGMSPQQPSRMTPASVPLRQFHRYALRSIEKNQLARMKVHNLVARRKTCCSDVRDLRLDIVHPEANVVHADLVSPRSPSTLSTQSRVPSPPSRFSILSLWTQSGTRGSGPL